MKISSEPSGADISVDGDYAGSTPSELKLKPGPHSLKITKKDYEPWAAIDKGGGGGFAEHRCGVGEDESIVIAGNMHFGAEAIPALCSLRSGTILVNWVRWPFDLRRERVGERWGKIVPAPRREG